MELWRRALDKLLAHAGTSKRWADRNKLAGREQFLRWKSAKRGPTLSVLERILDGLELSWQDWADLCEQVRKEVPVEKAVRGGVKYTYEKTPGKIVHGRTRLL